LKEKELEEERKQQIEEERKRLEREAEKKEEERLRKKIKLEQQVSKTKIIITINEALDGR